MARIRGMTKRSARKRALKRVLQIFIMGCFREFMASDEYYLAMPEKDNSEAENFMPEKEKEGDAL